MPCSQVNIVAVRITACKMHQRGQSQWLRLIANNMCSQDLERGHSCDYMARGNAPPGNLEIKWFEIASDAILAQKQSRSSRLTWLFEYRIQF